MSTPEESMVATSVAAPVAASNAASDEMVQMVEEEAPVPATQADGSGGSGGSLPPANADDTLVAEPDDEQEDDDGDYEDEQDGEAEDGEGGRMSLMGHLRELRQRILYSLGFIFVGFLLCWAFVEPVFDILTRPMLDALPKGGTAMYTTLPEAFFTRMYIAFFLGLFVASPFVFYQIWAFISPGLYEEEKNFVLPVALVSAVFFIAGGLFCYHVVFTYAFNFFMGFVTEDIQAMPKISEYLEFVLKMLLAFGLIFEMPIFAFFLSRMGVITAKGMRRVRRYAVLIIFIVAAVLTPPDVVSQLLMALPMLLLYEVSILVAAVFGKKPAEEPALTDETDEDDEDEEGEDEDWDENEDEDWENGDEARDDENGSENDGEQEPSELPEGPESPSTATTPAANGKADDKADDKTNRDKASEGKEPEAKAPKGNDSGANGDRDENGSTDRAEADRAGAADTAPDTAPATNPASAPKEGETA